MTIRLPPGLNFCPTDQELIKFYLRYKLVGKTLLPPEFSSYMPEKILYGKTADEPSKLFAGRSEEYLYFFTQVNKKFANSSNGSNYMERIAGNGSWRTQKTTKVFDLIQNSLVIGYRKNLTFDPKNKQEEEQNKPEKISYIMHEFTPLKYPPFQNPQAAEWTVCKIRKMVTKNNNYKPPPSTSLSSSMPKIKQAHDHGRKRARTSSHELMLQQSTTAPSTKAAVMPSYHPCADESLLTSTYYYDNNLPEFSQPHQSNYVAAQPDHEDAFDEMMSLLSSLDDLDVKLPPLEQESEDDMCPLNMGMAFTGMLLADNDDTNMLPNSTM